MKKTTNKTTGLLRSNARVTFPFILKDFILKMVSSRLLLLFLYFAPSAPNN